MKYNNFDSFDLQIILLLLCFFTISLVLRDLFILRERRRGKMASEILIALFSLEKWDLGYLDWKSKTKKRIGLDFGHTIA